MQLAGLMAAWANATRSQGGLLRACWRLSHGRAGLAAVASLLMTVYYMSIKRSELEGKWFCATVLSYRMTTVYANTTHLSLWRS